MITCRDQELVSAAKAIDAILAGGGSERLVKTIGTVPPTTMPAARPPAQYANDLNKMFPETISGTTRASPQVHTRDCCAVYGDGQQYWRY